MPTAIDTTTAIQDKIFVGIEAGQKAVVDGVKAWAETVETLFAKLPELATANPPLKPTQLVETTFGFTERLLASQKDFATKVFEAALPATKAASSAAAQYAKAAPKS